jgi:hypothetical protein
MVIRRLSRRARAGALAAGCAVVCAFMGCGQSDEDAGRAAGADQAPAGRWDGWAAEVVGVSYGEDAGFGRANFPQVVLGPPKGAGSSQGSLDVLSLGQGGTITVGFGPGRCILDAEGDDFTVLENVFFIAGDSQNRFIETAFVEVSQDGITFTRFPTWVDESKPCTREDASHCGDPARYRGFAGVELTLPGDSPAEVGGDRFDLARIGLGWARYVRITDTAGDPWDAGEAFGTGYGKAGFDLDAVGAIHRGEGEECPVP